MAVVMAVAAMKAGQVERIILTRPAVEAGESLGFLPGDLGKKVDPLFASGIVTPLYAVLGKEHTDRLMDHGVIEIAPLAYMRGRTLDNAFAILDEARKYHPSTNENVPDPLRFWLQKMIVNGDITKLICRTTPKADCFSRAITKGISQHCLYPIFRHRTLCGIRLLQRLLRLMVDTTCSCRRRRRSKGWI